MIFSLEQLEKSPDRTVSEMAKRLIELNISKDARFEIYLKQVIK